MISYLRVFLKRAMFVPSNFRVRFCFSNIEFFAGIHRKLKKLRSLFPLKDPIFHKVNVIYKGTCTSKEFYIGETKPNSEVRWNEHCSLKKSSQVGNHLLINPDHNITWQIIGKGSSTNI